VIKREGKARVEKEEINLRFVLLGKTSRRERLNEKYTRIFAHGPHEKI